MSVEDGALVGDAEALAAKLWTAAESSQTRQERAQAKRIARLLSDPAGLQFILALTDEVLRTRSAPRAARQFEDLIAATRSPGFLGPVDRALLGAGRVAARHVPRLVMALVRQRVGRELAGFVIPAERPALDHHVAHRRAQGIRLNINVLGEAILGDEESERRLQAVLDLLARPGIDYVSVKVSSVCAQLRPAAFDDGVDRVAVQIRRLYDAALASDPPKFVNLDMEEYRDLELTVAVFRRVLGERRYRSLDAGIVLQAYIPDSYGVLTELVEWARKRRARGGGVVKIRVVKGANLAMEHVEAEMGGWTAAPFASKAEVDANYKRMLDVLFDPGNAAALRVGVASHNVFDAAWALTLSRHRGVEAMVEMEMLEGMAPSLAAAVAAEAGGLLLYAPIARRSDHESVIAYLVRRFDENTGPENFLRHQFGLTVGSAAWDTERSRFREAVEASHGSFVASRRAAGSQLGHGQSGQAAAVTDGFVNQPDTDFAVPALRERVIRALGPGPVRLGGASRALPAVVAGRLVGEDEASAVAGIDPALPGQEAYRWTAVDSAHIDQAVAAAGPAGALWRCRPAAERAAILRRAADLIERDRPRLVAVMARDGGKTVDEADPEVSEAVDMARYYASCVEGLSLDGATFHPYGVVAVVPPWNFPLAIPTGGVMAALAAGAAVLLKPAPETVATARAIAEACWEVGVPRDVLQFVSCADGPAAQRLITHPGVDAVILTGAWDTARMFLDWRPDLHLHAETSGKNAMVITAAADLDAAVADLVRSAFGHAGQKCSAASLAIVEASVYDDARWRRQLADAVRTLRVGPGWDPRSAVGPLIRPPEGPLAKALTSLEPGEYWLVEPERISSHLWAPGVKFGVRPGSWFHLSECFGPVLGVMRATDLAEAIEWQNQPAYGLTAGLHSLDPGEIERWREEVQAGNLYVNRHTTGAIVRRQPFGGWKRSVVGPGAKAGGPNYVASLGTWTAPMEGWTPARFRDAVEAAWREELRPTDPSGLLAESNVLRYVPIRAAVVRVGPDVPEDAVGLAFAAASALGVAVAVSRAEAEDDEVLAGRWSATAAARRSGGAASAPPAEKVRFLGGVAPSLRLAAHDAGFWVDDRPVVAHPRLEALRWVREQAVSETRHRHGDLTERRPGLAVGGALA